MRSRGAAVADAHEGTDALMGDLSGVLCDLHRLSRVLFVMLQEARARGIYLEHAGTEGSRYARQAEAALNGPLRALTESLYRLEGDLSSWHGISLSRGEMEERMKAAERGDRLRPLDPAAFYGGRHR